MSRRVPSLVEQDFLISDSLPFLEVRTTMDSLCPYAPHFHETLSIGVILDGQTRFSCADSEELFAAKGDLVLIEPGMAHSCNPAGPIGRSYHMVYLDAAWCLEHIAPAASGFYIGVRKRLVRKSRHALLLAGAITRLRAGEHDAAIQVETVLSAILATWCLAVPENRLKPRTAMQTSAEGEQASVADMARRAGLCREGFSRSFKRDAGLSPGSYRQCLRLEYARRLLRTGKTIAEAAAMAGFADQSHMHRMFVRYCSMTPRQYRLTRSHLFKKQG